MNVLFVIARILTALASLSAFLLLSLIVLLRDAASTAKEGVQVLGYGRMIFTGASLEIVCLPFLVVWSGYYAMCLFRRNPQS